MEENDQSAIERLKKELQEKDRKIERLNRIIEVHEGIESLAEEEFNEHEYKLQKESELSQYSINELKRIDQALTDIVDIHREIDSSTYIRKDDYLGKLLNGLTVSIKAKRSILFFEDDSKGLKPLILNNITTDEIESDSFNLSMMNIHRCHRKSERIYKMMQEITINDKSEIISFVCYPLLFEEQIFGVIYLDIISDKKTFKMQDIDVGELFCSQAAMSISHMKLTEKANEKNLELMKLFNIKNQMVNQLSKEIEKPLTEVLQVLEKNFSCIEENPEINGMIKKISQVLLTTRKIIKMQNLEQEINDLFKEKVDIGYLFDFLYQTYESVINEKNIQYEITLSPHFKSYQSNFSILRTIFDEIFSNAVFYNLENGKVSVRGFKEGDFLKIIVSDTGQGIKDDDQQKIFNQFYRTNDSAKFNEKGAGLGLFLANKFVHYYHGQIELESTYGKGSSFIVTLMFS